MEQRDQYMHEDHLAVRVTPRIDNTTNCRGQDDEERGGGQIIQKTDEFKNGMISGDCTSNLKQNLSGIRHQQTTRIERTCSTSSDALIEIEVQPTRTEVRPSGKRELAKGICCKEPEIEMRRQLIWQKYYGTKVDVNHVESLEVSAKYEVEQPQPTKADFQMEEDLQQKQIKLNQSPLVKQGGIITYDGFETPSALVSHSKVFSMHGDSGELSNKYIESSRMKLFQEKSDSKSKSERYSIDQIYRDPVQEAEDSINLERDRREIMAACIKMEASDSQYERLCLDSNQFNVCQPVIKPNRSLISGVHRVTAEKVPETVLHSLKSSLASRGYPASAAPGSKKRPLEVLFDQA